MTFTFLFKCFELAEAVLQIELRLISKVFVNIFMSAFNIVKAK